MLWYPSCAPNTTSRYSSSDDDLFIGIPDAVVLSSSTSTLSLAFSGTATQLRPKQVTLPMPVEVKERYLEVREVGTDALITVIELLSLKNKRTQDEKLMRRSEVAFWRVFPI
jgi:Protein of unknown function (DUF4058)